MRAMVLLFLVVSPLQAGLYFADAPPPMLPAPENFRSTIFQLRGAMAAPAGRLDPDSPRARFQFLVRRLEQSRSEGPFSTADRVTLSAAYLRLNRPDEAIALLERGDKTHPLVLANLATAYFVTGNLRRALDHQSDLLRNWPAVLPHWTSAELSRLRRAEQLFERLLRSRLLEQNRSITRDLPLDPLFDKFTVEALENAEGDYAPWDVSRAVRDSYPLDGNNSLVQLLLWLPADARLYWLMAEVMTAQGHLELGTTMFEDLVNSGEDFKGLRRHRKVMRQVMEDMRFLFNPVEKGLLNSAGLMPSFSLTPPGGSGVMLATSAFFRPLATALPTPPAPSPEEEKPTSENAMPFNWRHIAVSFAFGFLVAALIGFQMQEWRRRSSQAEEHHSGTV